MLKKIVGEIIGSVTCQKRCQALAPSIDAASYSSCGTPCRPARKTIIRLPPMPPHSAMITSDGIAQMVLCSQRGPSMPTRLSR